MGGVCSVCKQPTSTDNEKFVAPGRAPASPRPSMPPRREQHDGQRRSTLVVKEGGFALKNFNVTNPGKLDEHFDVDKTKIGEGGFGSVSKGKDRRTGHMCAIKTIRKSAEEEVARMKEEIEIMRLLDHPNIVRFVESFEDKRCIYIALELCEGGELFERICKAGSFTEEVGAGCVRQMLLAINYLHQNLIMHRDLKPENWLLSSREAVEKSHLKLIDFGISRKFDQGVPCRTKAGTPNYVAPEVLAGRYDEKVDVWSIGVITFVMLSGQHPFSGKTAEQVLAKVKQGTVLMDGAAWKRVTADGKGFVKSCLQKSASFRLGAAQALNHTWFHSKTKAAAADFSRLDVSGLKAFGRMHQLKRAAVTVIATQLSHSKIDNLRSMFMVMDKNNDGALSISEIKKGLHRAGVELPGDLDELLSEADTDGSGVIDYTEFLAATMDKKEYHQEDVVWNAFKKFDLDGSGTIDRKELGKVLGDDHVKSAMHLDGQDRLQEVFDSVDQNGDGIIDFKEFFAMMQDRSRLPVRKPSPRRHTSPGRRHPDESARSNSPSSARSAGGGAPGSARRHLGAGGGRHKIGIGQADQELLQARRGKMRAAAVF